MNVEKWSSIQIFIIVVVVVYSASVNCLRSYSKERMLELREEVRHMFQHAYEGYLRHASDYDELRPLTCDGIDTWGSYSLTLVDALDTLATMGNFSEFRRVALLLEQKMDFDKDINVSVFETNIRIVGGLLSAHLISKRAGLQLEEGWPCQGPLLRLAEDVAKRLLPAFDTATGMPYGTVNLRYGVPKGETAVTCTAGVGTLLVEFGSLSRLTGNPIFEEVAMQAVYALWERRSPIGLLGNHIDVQTGRWTALDAGIGAGVDSFFEYLVKGAILLNRPELMDIFHKARDSIEKYMKKDDWYVWVNMNKGQVTLPVFQSLEAFWPGILSMIGDTSPAIRTLSKYASLWRKYGFLPEFFNLPTNEPSANREGYPLRPELVESAMYLYKATKNQMLLELGEDMLRSIEFSAKTKCGYATIRNVRTHEKDNRMESFFLAETTKYLYLLFDEDNFLHSDGSHGERLGDCVVNAGAYIFNSEAHPVDMSALYCCHDLKEDVFANLDLSQFSDTQLLRADHERTIQSAVKNRKFNCMSSEESKAPKSSSARAKKDNQDSPVVVDIDVLDEDNQPAAQILIDNFERIKAERETGNSTESSASGQTRVGDRNQLTVMDLEEFFDRQRWQFQEPADVYEFVVKFMRNFTLDPAFIRGLKLFDKKISEVLGAAAQKEFENEMRTLWDLYELQVKFTINVGLVQELGVNSYTEEHADLLDIIDKAFKRNASSESKAGEGSGIEESPMDVIQSKIDEWHKRYVWAIRNTTAMQEFLLNLLISGSGIKARSVEPFLSDSELQAIDSEIAEDRIDVLERRKLFAHAIRLITFKRRMITTFQALQSLIETNRKTEKPVDESKSSAKSVSFKEDVRIDSTAAPAIANPPIAANPTLATEEETPSNALSNADVSLPKPSIVSGEKGDADVASATATETATATASKAVTKSKAVDSDNLSIWGHLMHKLLRNPVKTRTEFDEQALLQKTRNLMLRYVDHQSLPDYELLTCRSPKFYEKFTFRNNYP